MTVYQEIGLYTSVFISNRLFSIKIIQILTQHNSVNKVLLLRLSLFTIASSNHKLLYCSL